MKSTQQSRVTQVMIEDELQQSFLDYAMSVIVSRALPDVRDGLKPVHRRILYTMNQLGFHYNKSYHKSVRIVGDVMAKYHPHGNEAIYQSMVGLVQNFAKRYPLLDGQGNWGSVDGDNAAAMRYTEVRMQRIAQELLADLDKETVPFIPNFDESNSEPTVLPSRLPHLLINGTSGIAVGMATSIPPHNLTEVIEACRVLLIQEQISDEELFKLIPGPDFPTGGIICGRAGIVKAYTTGRGSVIVRGVTRIDETKKGTSIIITELPYQVVKSELVMKIAELVKEKIIDGITDIRDESDRQGMRVVVTIRRGESPEVILNQLYKLTSLQTTIGILMLGILDNRPLVMTLRQLLQEFLYHRETVITRRTRFDLKKAHEREHILLGLSKALKHLDEIITLIKGSSEPQEALVGLQKQFSLSEVQATAILDMRLHRLTGLEQQKIFAELQEIAILIQDLQEILSDKNRLKREILQEFDAIKEQYADERRTKISGPINVLEEADLIADEEVVVTLTRKGYIKRVPLTVYGVQHRGGKGKIGIGSLEESDDIVADIFAARNHDELLFFTNFGRIYGLQVFQIPEASRTAKGRAAVNLLELQAGETVVKLLCARDFSGKYLVLVTENGTIKRTEAHLFTKIRSTGIRAITLDEKDRLAFCALSSGNDFIVLATRKGKGIRFLETEVRSMGRHASGVRGIRLKEDDIVVGLQVVTEDQDLLIATSHGYGKRLRVGDFRQAHRGGQGVLTIPTNERNGDVIGLITVNDESHVLLIDAAGTIIRLSSGEIRTMGRQAKGVRLIRLDEQQVLATMVVVPAHEAVETPESAPAVPSSPASSTPPNTTP
jgi:DNA gyrase subunit A